MKTENNLIRQYLNEVGIRLDCPKPVKKIFLKELHENITLFQAQQSELTKETLYSQFGTPEEIATGFFDRQDFESLLRKTKKRVLCWKVVGILACAVLLLIILYLIHILQETSLTIHVTNPI